MRAWLADMRLVLTSPGFVLAALLVFASLFYARESPGMSSAVSAFEYPIKWNNVSSFLCIAVTLCGSADIVRDASTHSAVSQIVRVGKKRYLTCRFAACFVSTALATVIGFGLFLAVVSFDSQAIVSQADVDSSYYFGAFSEFLYSGTPALWFVSVITFEGLLCGVLGCLGMACATFSPNRYVAIVMPFVIVFFWAKVCVWCGLTPWVNIQSLMKLRPFIEGAGACVLAYLGVVVVLLLATHTFFRIGAKRMMRGSL